MLYLVRPDQPLTWIDLPASLLEVATEQGADFATLDWQPAEASYDDVVVALALRHGVGCSSGIVLDGGVMSLRLRPAELVRTHQAASTAQAELSKSPGQLMEHLLPGWTDSTNELNARVDQSANKVLNEAIAELNAAIQVPVKSELEQHWTRLGGRIPVLG
jgi:hypothetical protein